MGGTGRAADCTACPPSAGANGWFNQNLHLTPMNLWLGEHLVEHWFDGDWFSSFMASKGIVGPRVYIVRRDNGRGLYAVNASLLNSSVVLVYRE